MNQIDRTDDRHSEHNEAQDETPWVVILGVVFFLVVCASLATQIPNQGSATEARSFHEASLAEGHVITSVPDFPR